MPDRILVTGPNGLLGSALVPYLRSQDDDVVALPHEIADITDAERLRRTIEDIKPRQIINLAAYTNVNRAEREFTLAHRVNAEGARNVAEIARQLNARLIHVSTNFVFAGDKGSPYVESDLPSPVNVYGKSKLAGEQAVYAAYPSSLILRVGWLFGPGGQNFVATILDRGLAYRVALQQQVALQPIRIVVDQRGVPTSTLDVAQAIGQLVSSDITGVLHLVPRGEAVDRFSLVTEIFEMAGMQVAIEPSFSSEFKSDAPRPKAAILGSERDSEPRIPILRNWREALRDYVDSEMQRRP